MKTFIILVSVLVIVTAVVIAWSKYSQNYSRGRAVLYYVGYPERNENDVLDQKYLVKITNIQATDGIKEQEALIRFESMNLAMYDHLVDAVNLNDESEKFEIRLLRKNLPDVKVGDVLVLKKNKRGVIYDSEVFNGELSQMNSWFEAI